MTVREENRRKVETAIKRMGYIPNYLAKGLTSKQSFAIGLVVTSISNSYYLEITDAIERRLREMGFMLFLCSTDGDIASEQRYLFGLLARRVDGIILIDPSNEGHASGLFSSTSARVPLVLVHSNSEICEVNSVVIDQILGMRMVMEHLRALGHVDIGFLRGREGYSYDIKEEAWRRYLTDLGAAPAPDRLIVIEQGNTTEAIGLAEEASTALFRGKSFPSAIFACNDLMAVGVLKAAAREGIAVPGELSVVGHDNTSLAMSGHVQLTSVDLKMRSLGAAAIDLLIHAMSGKDPTPRKILINPELVVRESTGPISGTSLR